MKRALTISPEASAAGATAYGRRLDGLLVPSVTLKRRMPTVINNPYAGVDWAKQYKANLHTHTTRSDGAYSPAEMIDRYAAQDYDILALTDHNTQTDPVGSTTWPWSDFGRDPATLGMLAVEGNEISQSDHIVSLFTGYGEAENTSEAAHMAAIAAIVDGVAILAHPGRYGRTTTWYMELVNAFSPDPFVGMEVVNQGDRFPNDRVRWDAVNAVAIPQGITVWGCANDDYHGPPQLGRDYTWYLLPELTTEALRAAMISGASYFSHEPLGTGSALAPRIQGLSVSEPTANLETVVTVTSSNADSVAWFSDLGQVGSSASLVLKPGLRTDVFVRAVLTNTHGVTYTQPLAVVWD